MRLSGWRERLKKRESPFLVQQKYIWETLAPCHCQTKAPNAGLQIPRTTILYHMLIYLISFSVGCVGRTQLIPHFVMRLMNPTS